MREDPGTTFSDRSWAQRLLARASLGKRERLDVFFSAGGSYIPRDIERALRHRCQKIHEEERRLPSSFRKPGFARSTTSSRSMSSSMSASTSSTFSKGKGKGKGHGVHVASLDEEPEGEDFDEELEDLEGDPEAYEAYMQEHGDREESLLEENEDEEMSEEDGVTRDDLQEAYAAGWRAKDKISEKKKGRSFHRVIRVGGGKRDEEDPRKKSTTCSSCGGLGHWKGDPQCPKVKSGEDPLFKPKPKGVRHGVHYVSTPPQKDQVSGAKPTFVSKDVKVHEINFAFMVGDPRDSKSRRPAAKEKNHVKLKCSQCTAEVKDTDRFCSSCGMSLAARMVDAEKRHREAISLVSEDEDEGFTMVKEDKIPIPRRAAAQAAGVTVKTEVTTTDVTPIEAMAAVPFMSNSERKALMRRLKKEEEAQRPREEEPSVEDIQRLRRSEDLKRTEGLMSEVNLRGYASEGERWAHRTSGGARASTDVAPGRSLTTLTPPTKELPEPVKKRQLDEFRWNLYNERIHKGRLVPSEAAPLPNQEQKACPHPWNRLRWSANQHGHFARCRACDLKNVLCWHERHGSYVADGNQEFLPKCSILAIADSGCKTAVGGEQWHRRFQQALMERGLTWTTVEEKEVFKFGAGEPCRSAQAHVYPIGLHGHNSYLRMSEVGGDAADCPGLVGPADLSRWRVCFKFGEKMLEAMGVVRPMVLTTTRHPGLDLLDYGSMESFQEKELMGLKSHLIQDPYAFAFVAAEEEVSVTEDEEEEDVQDEEDQGVELAEEDVEKAEMKRLVEDMEQVEIPMHQLRTSTMPGDESTEDASGGESTTSHEFGVEWSEDDSTDEEVEERKEEATEVFWAKLGAMTKGKKRRVRSNVKEVRELLPKKTPIPKAMPRASVGRPQRPYKVLEIFTWTLSITMAAVGRGWQGCEPITLPRWDLRSVEDRKLAFEYLVETGPDLLVVAWPCTVWSPLQFLGNMTQERHDRLLQRQQEDRDTFLSFVHDAVRFQRDRGRAHLGENPWRSGAWKEPWIQSAYDGESYARTDMCQFGLRKPDTKELLMKPTCLAGTRDLVEACAKQCSCERPHAHTLGTYRDREGKHRSVAEFAGGYTLSFARTVVKAAEHFLDHWQPHEVQVFATDDVPEERFMEIDDEPPEIREEHQEVADLEAELEAEIEDGGAELKVPRNRDGPIQPQDESVHHHEERKDFPSHQQSSIHEAVVKMHRRLGHPGRDALVRMLKTGGAPKEVLDYAKEYECPVCQTTAPPDRPFQQKARPRPAGFNVEVHVDLKYAKNVKDQTYVAMSMICAGTNKHAAVLLKTRKPSYVAKKFVKHWIAPFGRPSRVVMDQGGEFEKEWILMLEQFGIHSTTTGSHAGWQHALAERHGGLLGITWHSLIVEYNATSHSDMALTLAAAIEAKNEVVTRRGYSPNMLVFGKSISYPELLGEEEFDPVTVAQGLDVDTEVSRRSKMRQKARQVLLRDDVQQKMKKALQKNPSTQDRIYVPGETIYFFVPHPSKPRYRRDSGRWRGPAVVLLQESHQRYFVSWRGRCLLLAAPNMRPASAEEALAREFVQAEMQQMEDLFGQEGEAKNYEDLADQPPPPTLADEERKRRSNEARRMMAGTKSVRKLIQNSRMLKNQRTLGLRRLPGPATTTVKRRRPKAIKDGSLRLQEEERVAVEDPYQGEAEDDTDEERFWTEVREQEDAYARERDEEERRLQRLSADQRRRMSLDDLPEVLKKKREVEDEGEQRLTKRLRGDFFSTVMLAVSEQDLRERKKKSTAASNGMQKSHKSMSTSTTRARRTFSQATVKKEDENLKKRRANEWVTRSEIQKLRQLLDMPVVSARLHLTPRKRMQRPPEGRSRGRVSVLLGQSPGMALLVEETSLEVCEHPRRRAPFPWRGMTLFIKEPQEEFEEQELVFVEHGDVMYQVPFPKEHQALWTQFLKQEEVDQKVCDTFLLRMKTSGKELDPRYFNFDEQEKFRQADSAEWLSWIKNGVVEVVPKHLASKIPKEKVFRIPLRWVRVSKNKEMDAAAQFLAKSRLVVPGHADPHLGEYRTDAPTVNPVSVRLLKTLAATKNWVLKVFDVSTAFLSGNKTDREVYVRAPVDGLPQTAQSASIPPLSLLRVLKSAYGLAEAPRLWYLRAAQLLQECGLQELTFSRSTFVASDDDGPYAICTLHVDDGMLGGSEKCKKFQRLLKMIDQRFNIKEWKTVGREPIDFLGCKVFREGRHVVDCMKGYTQKIEPMKTVREERDLNDQERTAFRRLIMQLRWPAQHVLPEKLYAVSELAQAVTKSTMSHARAANSLLATFKKFADDGMMRMVYRPLPDEPCVVSFFDASLGKSTGVKAQQGQAHFLSVLKVKEEPVVSSMVEFRSSRITRVVKSSLAAEGNALSTAADEQLFLRLLTGALWYGPEVVKADWKESLRVPGIVVTDAKALFDHLEKTGHMTSERQTMLDILAAKQLVESASMMVAWVPTFRQFADALTKDMVDELFKKYKCDGLLCLRETADDARLEAHRASLRKAQRERRKLRMKAHEV